MTRPCVLSASAALFVLASFSSCTPATDNGHGSHTGSGGSASGSGGTTSSSTGGSSGRGGSVGSGGSASNGSGGSSQSGSGGTTSASGGSSGSGGASGSGGRAGGSGGQGGSGTVTGGTTGGGSGGSTMGDAGTAPETTPAAGPKLSTDVLPIVKTNCARAGCHDPIKKEHGLDLSTAATIYSGWVNKMAADHCMNNAAVTLVVPGKPDNSFIVTLIKNIATRCADLRRMPPAPLPPLSAADVKTISDWVTAGALNN